MNKFIKGMALLFMVSLLLFACVANKPETSPIDLAIRMAQSDMKRNPEAWQIDFRKTMRWGYTHGLVGLSYEKLSLFTGDQQYYQYIKNGFADKMVDEVGVIDGGYRMDVYNIDYINPGKMFFYLYENTGDERYLTVLKTLRQQMEGHPRTSDGGFWHKKVYPHQMWLDGIYMANPFLAQYGQVFNEPALFNEVAHQILTVQKHTYDAVSGLNYHGWDESREQAWADPETGKSPNFWGRAQGWYCMAIIDVLEFLPDNHPKRTELIQILSNLFDSLLKVRDPQTGMWYQVLDQGQREGNYLESTASVMFIYSMLKAVRLNYVDQRFKPIAVEAFQQMIDAFIIENEDQTISITNCVAVSGLGGNPYRDGSYEYYLSEPVRNDDPKAVGPFIMACIELEKLNQIKK